MAEEHEIEWDYDPDTDSHIARCACGWETSVGGGQQAELERRIAVHHSREL